MEVELFNICEGAFNHDGRLTLVEVFDRIHVTHVPLEIACGVAIKLLFSNEDVGKHTLTVNVLHEDKPDVIGQYSSNVEVPENAGEGRLAVAINIRGFKLPWAGKYTIRLEVDGNVLKDNIFLVINHEGDQK